MKRFFILASAAIVALASCAKTEVVNTDGPQEIAFKQLTGPITKGETLSAAIQLGVYAHQGENLYFGNTAFTHNGTDWTGNRYWPYDKSGLDFTVYAPYSSHTETTYDSTNKILTVGDVTAGEASYYGSQRYLGVTKPDLNAAYPVILKHMSSKISVSVKGTDDVYKVTSLVLDEPVVSGEVDVNYTNNTAPTVAVVADPAPTKADISFLDNGATAVELTTTAVKVGEDEFVLPGEQTSFTITFDQYTNGIDKTEKLSFSETIDLTDTWVANKHYHYTINISAEEIHLTATVEDWDTVTEVPVELPKQN